MKPVLNCKADYEAAFETLFKENAELKARVEALEAKPTQTYSRFNSVKPDYKAQLNASPELLAAFKQVKMQCSPLHKTGESKFGKNFATFKDYITASSAALKANNIQITFVENKDTMKLKTIVYFLNTDETRSFETQAELAKKDDMEKAIFFGFLNLKTRIYGSLLELDK